MKQFIFIIISIFLLNIGCSDKKSQIFNQPKILNDHWQVAAPENAGFDKHKLMVLLNRVSKENPKLNSLVVARYGKLIVDEYFNGYTPDSVQNIWSITKLITGTIIGIAEDKGLLSITDPIKNHLGEYKPKSNPNIDSVTIEHLITMTSGFDWIELGGPKSAGFELAYSNDWVAFVLNQPHNGMQGKRFNYSTGNSILLAPIIKNTTGKQANEFANIYLFKPLGIKNYCWDKQSEFWIKTQNGELPGATIPKDITYIKPLSDFTNTGTGLHMQPRDLCKIGQLYLNKGKWNGKQILSEDWIKASTKPHFGNTNYGYHWRLMNIHNQTCYYATGFGMQRMFVFPALELIVVMNQQHYKSLSNGEKCTNEFLLELLLTLNK